jgi:hypothetical protein
MVVLVSSGCDGLVATRQAYAPGAGNAKAARLRVSIIHRTDRAARCAKSTGLYDPVAPRLGSVVPFPHQEEAMRLARIVSVVGTGVIAFGALADCGAAGFGDAAGRLGGASCPEMAGNVDALGAIYAPSAHVNAKVRTFVNAAKDLGAIAAQAEAEAAEACMRIAADLGASPAEMAARDEPGGRASGACAAASARLDGVLRSGLSFRANVTPPRCEASAQAQARCSGACSAEVNPGEVVARCEPARLSGYCQGRCSGRCEGRCVGQCRGQCSAVDAQGNCVGGCNGDCYGSCDATCHARCEGQWQSPRCEGWVQPPSADAECNASCRAHANFHASCTPVMVTVQASQNSQLAMRLVASLQANLPQLLHAQWVLGQRVMADIETTVQVGKNLPGIVGEAGVHAIACIANAASVSARASRCRCRRARA